MRKTNNQNGKLTDKEFLRIVVTSFFAIFVCIVVLCSTTFAWFTNSSSSNMNTIKSGNFNADIVVTDVNGDKISLDNGSYTLGNAGTYTFSISHSESSSLSRGHCIVKIGDDSYKTAAIISGENEPFTFKIVTVADGVVVSIESSWGIPSEIKINSGNILTINNK